jgi:hypothetical protein
LTLAQARNLDRRIDKRSPILLYAQPSLDLALGQGVAAPKDPKDPAALTLAEPAQAGCVSGDLSSALDERRATGAAGLDMKATGIVGPGGALASAPKLGSFPVSPLVLAEGVSAALFLEDVAAYQLAVQSAPTRVSGYSEVLVEHNSFHYRNERRASTAPECGDLFVRKLTSSRFFSYAFVIEFPKAEAAKAFQTKWKNGANMLFSPSAELSDFLVEHSGTIGVHVLAPDGLARYVAGKIGDERCDALHLDACASLRDTLLGILKDLPSLPGSDETLESVAAPGASWGFYGVTLTPYSAVAP